MNTNADNEYQLEHEEHMVSVLWHMNFFTYVTNDSRLTIVNVVSFVSAMIYGDINL